MKYYSTRDDSLRLTSKEAILKGISEDGGLFVPESFPEFDIEKYLELPYGELAYEVLKNYLTDYSEEELRSSIKHAYSEKFIEGVAPVKEVGGTYYLELYHGPTLAFKDFALMLLPKLMEQAKASLKDKNKTLILTATSGDTGKAALEGFSNLEGIDIVVFYPVDGVSKIQELQMVTTPAENTCVVAVNGNFDDAQTGVKEIFNDVEFNELLKKKKIQLSSANSINIGRLLPQIVYYFHAYATLRNRNEISKGEKVVFTVPTGNFGDILAGYYAMKMGLPVEKLVVASNENKVLTEFFEIGLYDANRDLIVTNSPSMDIVISSNLERLLYHKLGNVESVKSLQGDLKSKGSFEVNCEFSEFSAGSCSQEDTLKTIKHVFEDEGYLIDTHTAVAKYVADKYGVDKDSTVIVLSTASPFKFPEAVGLAIGEEIIGDEFSAIYRISGKCDLEIPESLKNLKSMNIKHKIKIEKNEMKDTILRFAGDVIE